MKPKKLLSLIIIMMILSTLTAISLTSFAADGDITYLYYDADSKTMKTGTKASGEYSVPQSSSSYDYSLGTAGTTTWYYANSNITITRVTMNGDVHLVLADGITVTVTSNMVVNSGNSLTIYAQSEGETAGTLTSSATYYCAAIGGNKGNSAGTITINGGNINATGGAQGAGIGGGQGGSGGVITINGGNITTKGGTLGAGIGGGSNGSAGTITINGGTINATGGEYESINGGPGIGNGDFTEIQGFVTINGGCVNATGGSHGAGIGGAYLASGCKVVVNGGIVNAIAGSDAKGIGEGLYSSEGGTFDTGTDGKAVVFATSISDSDSANWTGIVFIGTSGKLYGTSVTVAESFEIPSGYTLTISSGQTLIIPKGVEIINNGTIGYEKDTTLTNNGTISGEGTIVKTCAKHEYDNNEICQYCDGYKPSERISDAASEYNGYYKIGSLGNLMWLAEQINSGIFSAHKAVMTADITIDDSVVWKPIGLPDGLANASTFDGGGYTITFANTNTESNYGLFERYNYSVIENLMLDGSISVNTEGNIGVLVNSAYRTTIRNVISYCDITNAATSGNTGGLAGYFGGGNDTTNNRYSLIENCAVYADVTGGGNTGGFIGFIWGGNQYCTIRNGAYVGTVKSSTNSGAIVGGNGNNSSTTSTLQNLYYVCADSTVDYIGNRGSGNLSVTNVEAKTEANFASGEVTYLLNGDQTAIAFGQTLTGDSKDAYPVFYTGSNQVYYSYFLCTKTTMGYRNTTELDHDSATSDYLGGFCSNCGAYQPAADSEGDGCYEIDNVGNLMWFAELVNGGEKNVNAVLTADIDMTDIEWTPICSTALYYSSDYSTGEYPDAGYTGIFDGDGYVIKNLSVTGSTTADVSFGLFGTVSGTVKNLGMENFTYTGAGKDTRIGSIAGQLIGGKVLNCYAANLSINTQVNTTSGVAGGIAGCNYAGTIDNCHVYNLTMSAGRYGGVVGDNRADSSNDRIGTMNNCYSNFANYVGNYKGTEENCAVKLDRQFTGGEACYLLNEGVTDGTQTWYQTLDTDTYPKLAGETVYQNTCDEATFYANNVTDYENHELDDDFSCKVCKQYDAAELVNGVYEIDTASKLFWFAQTVNSGSTGINAVLTADIDLNNLEWTPIGNANNIYTGTFDGKNHIVSDLAMNVTASNQGFFGYINKGTVKNLTVKGKIEINAVVDSVGGIVSSAQGASYVQNCHSYVDITVNDGYAGCKNICGVVGRPNSGVTIENCSNYGTITATGAIECIGGITGYANENTKIINCVNYGTINGDTARYVSGILGYINNSSFKGIQNCLNVGKITGASYVGAIVGIARDYATDTIVNNYYLNTSAETGVGADEKSASKTLTVTDKTADELASGEVCYLLGSAFGQTINTDDYPILGDDKVYKYTDGYSNELKFGFADCTADGAIINIPTAGTYSLVFADYEGGRLNDIDIVTVTVTAETIGEITKASEKGVTLATSDKITLWQDMTNLVPMCDAYIVK